MGGWNGKSPGEIANGRIKSVRSCRIKIAEADGDGIFQFIAVFKTIGSAAIAKFPSPAFKLTYFISNGSDYFLCFRLLRKKQSAG